MKELKLYRKRFIPQECIYLKNDTIVKQDEKILITKWTTINPKPSFSHGCSCYFFDLGFKISKIYQADGSLLYWYCDIVEFNFQKEENILIINDLLADIIVYSSNQYQVLDLDELATAFEQQLISPAQLTKALYQVNNLLNYISKNEFYQLQKELENLGL